MACVLPGTDACTDGIRSSALPLTGPESFDPLMERIGDARYVLLGEASHGTAEFYRWRAGLTRRLIEEKGFSFVAVEDDWPGCQAVHCSVTAAPGAPQDPVDVLEGFGRWGGPTRTVRVPEAREGSTEDLMHRALPGAAALFLFPSAEHPVTAAGSGIRWWEEERDHRAIGVVYRPEREKWGNYVSTVLGGRYDAFLFFDRTSALSPLHAAAPDTDEAETWPTGM